MLAGARSQGAGGGGEGRRTPHLALLLDVRVLHAQHRPPLRLVDVNLDKVRYIVLDFACTRQSLPHFPTVPTPKLPTPSTRSPRPRPRQQNTQPPNRHAFTPNTKARKEKENIPSGPVTVTVLSPFSRYDVKSFLAHLSPTRTSTPGGTEIGVLPSFDPLTAVPANPLRAPPAPSAGTLAPHSALPAAVRPGRKTDMAPLVNAPRRKSADVRSIRGGVRRRVRWSSLVVRTSQRVWEILWPLQKAPQLRSLRRRS